uniref:Uncharacterized protein n=1 Tax=Glossina palpalis gambiensis TaxID=67801 RepID=A0A1B0C4T0_9MUSC
MFFKNLKYRIVYRCQSTSLTKVDILCNINGFLCASAVFVSIILFNVLAIAICENRTPAFNVNITSTVMTLMIYKTKQFDNNGNDKLDILNRSINTNIDTRYGSLYTGSNQNMSVKNQPLRRGVGEQLLSKQQEELQWPAMSAAYLLGRNDGNTHDRSGYGTWHTKINPSKLIASPTIDAEQEQQSISSNHRQSLFVLPENATKGSATNFDYNMPPESYNYYKTKHRRPFALKLVQSDLLARRLPLNVDRNSVDVHRQYNTLNAITDETSSNDNIPKPFHTPSEGSLPTEFKKPATDMGIDASKTGEFSGDDPIFIRILPSHISTPTVLHISGSFNNFKLSSFINFLRGKRQKPSGLWQQYSTAHAHLHGKSALPTPTVNLEGQRYQDLIMDQFHLFRPPSPYDINFMAFQQPKHVNNLRAQNSIYKRLKKDTRNDKIISGNNLTFSQYASPSKYNNVLYPSFYSPYNGLNVIRSPELINHEPFKVKLDISPLWPMQRNVRGSTAPNMEENTFKPSIKLNSISFLENAHTRYLTAPLPVSISADDYYNSFCSRKRPTQVKDMLNQISQARISLQHTVYPHQTSKYRQQERQSLVCDPTAIKRFKRFPAYRPISREQFLAIANSTNPKAGPITVHLNIFSKHRLPSTSNLSNPFNFNA